MGDIDIALLLGIDSNCLKHDFEWRGQEVAFDGSKAFAEKFYERIKLFFASEHAYLLRWHKVLIDIFESMEVDG